MTLPLDPIQLQPTYATASGGVRTAAVDSRPVRQRRGRPAARPSRPAFERSWPSFPIPGTTARSWYLGPDGALGDSIPAEAGADSFTWDAHARPLTDFTGDTAAGPGGLWTATPGYDWTQSPTR